MKKPTYALISLGCPKNLIDSECMAGRLGLDGYRMVSRAENADFVVVNTCGFIGDARNESHAAIREMLDLKRRGRLGGIIVAGCMAERDKERLLERYPGIDQIVGVFARDEIGAAADRLMKGRGPISHRRGTNCQSAVPGGRLEAYPTSARTRGNRQ
jgi:ribosomal protein S12 methylthiotransferase